MYVSELIIPNTSTWNVSLLHNLFLVEVVEKITRIQINKNEEDITRWKPTRDGSLTVKTAFNKLVENSFYYHETINTVPKKVWKSL